MHHSDTIAYGLFLIFTGAALVSTFALFTRQSMLVGYIIVGVILGPWGAHLIGQSHIIDQTGDVGIIFLLFLLGLHLHPQKLLQMFSKTVWIALVSSTVFALGGYAIARFSGCNPDGAMLVGLATMFSSTIIGLKLLPTTVLHHQHTGEIVISILLLQDLIAIGTLVFLHGAITGQWSWQRLSILAVAFPALLLIGYLMQRFVLIRLIRKFDRIHEYVFLLSIGWCLGMSQLGEFVGLSGGIGAFIAGVALAAHPISQYIAESLKPLRDFFLILFFFSIGARFDLQVLPHVLLPALLLALFALLGKPVVFQLLLRQLREKKQVAWEVGWRLGQISEFSLLIAYFAEGSRFAKGIAPTLIEAATIITFMVSSYIVLFRYPTPMAFSDQLRRD